MIKEFLLDKYWVSATRVKYQTEKFEAEYSITQISPNWVELAIRPGSHSDANELLEYIHQTHWIDLLQLEESRFLNNPFWKFYKINNFDWNEFIKPFESAIEESKVEKLAYSCKHLSIEELEKVLDYRKQNHVEA